MSDGVATMNYTYDAQGRRVKSTVGSTERRFLVAPTLAGDLESPWLVADGNNAVLAGYAYAGAYPLMRFDASGVPTYYLEDAMHSVIGTADGAGLPVAHFHYDGFGNVRAAAGETNALAGVGGEFRFQGHWLEEASGLYHMRARDYDARTGRFLVRDPVEGNIRIPDTMHPYQFAFANPHYYSDPSGEFSVIEINITGAIQNGLQGARTYAINNAKQEAISQVLGGLENFLWKQIGELLPIDLSSFTDISGQLGQAFENHARAFFCAGFKKTGMGDAFHYNVRVRNTGRRSGDPYTPGRNCEGPNPGIPGTQPLSWAVPDFIISSDAPYGPQSQMPSAWLVGDFKASSATFYNAYVHPGANRDQFTGIIDYAKKHTYSRTALYIAGWNNLGSHQGARSNPHWKAIRKLLGQQLTRRGVIGLMVTVLN